MSPSEHYDEAERLLDLARRDDACADVREYWVAAAQVHATLATYDDVGPAATAGGAR